MTSTSPGHANVMEALLAGLNAAQQSAVSSPAAVVQVLAPPGSGKTKTLTARVAYLVKHEHLRPWNIIVCTFTIKAAREMKERIRGFVGDQIASKLILGTFHSVARRFLSRYGQEIGLPKTFGIADTNDSNGIIKRIIQRQRYAIEPSHARNRISSLKAKGISVDEFMQTRKKAEHHDFICVYAEYQEHLRTQNLLDYDDLLVRCVELLRKNPACVSGIQAVLIDEYQDTNNIQYDLMRLMSQYARRVTIVGDPDQSIYSFRSAEIKNLFRMRDDYPGSVVINLEENYRSSGCILRLAKAVIEQDETRPIKPLVATHCFGEQPTLRHLGTANIEAKWIQKEINRTKTLSTNIFDYNDYAILIRSASLSLSIERALGHAGVPYRMVGGKRFFDRAEIKIILDYLRVINQPEFNDALVRVINLPSRKIGESTIRALLEEAEKKQTSLWTLVLDRAQGRRMTDCKIAAPALKGIETFVNLILTSRRKLLPGDGQGCNLVDLISHVLQKISYENYLKHAYKDNWRDRWANVEELVLQATQLASTLQSGEDDDEDALPFVDGLEQRHDTAADVLSKFLCNVALSTEPERPDGEVTQQVTISTIHAAKGLEWPVVFIPAVYDGSIPHSRADDHDEERRLLYVGMTRAQALLYLSCPVRQSSQDETTLSDFISHPSIQKYFNHNGPTFGYAAIQDIAKILRRPCPAYADVQKARSTLERFEDDEYPIDRHFIDAEELPWTTAAERVVPHLMRKRKWMEELPSTMYPNLSIPMQDAQGYSVSATPIQSAGAGFTSARDIRALQQEAEAVRMLTSAGAVSRGKNKAERTSFEGVHTVSGDGRVPAADGLAGVTDVPGKKVKTRVLGQEAITNFFPPCSNASAPEAAPPHQNTVIRESTSAAQSRALVDITNGQTQSRPWKVAQDDQFSTLRNAYNAPMTTKPKAQYEDEGQERARYVLLSSSPTKAGGLTEHIDLTEDDSTSIAPVSTSPSRAGLQHAGADFRPASTFHVTSMDHLHANIGPQRKTLGARRSMQGWSVKHSQPPKPRQV